MWFLAVVTIVPWVPQRDDDDIDDKCLEFYHMSVFYHMVAISDAIDKLNAPVKILSSERGLPSEMMISVSKLML